MATLTVSANFYNYESLKNREQRNLFDPNSIEVQIIDSNLHMVLKPEAIRLSQGKYIANIDTDSLIDGNSYEIRWVYDLYPDSYQVQRYSFKYLAAKATISGMCRIYGTVNPLGIPIPSSEIEYSTFKNGYSKHFAQIIDKSISDVFGQWDIYLPYGVNAQISIPVINDYKYFEVPSQSSISFNSISSLLVTYTATDSFGNPV